jgi:hypothetical protein
VKSCASNWPKRFLNCEDFLLFVLCVHWFKKLVCTVKPFSSSHSSNEISKIALQWNLGFGRTIMITISQNRKWCYRYESNPLCILPSQKSKNIQGNWHFDDGIQSLRFQFSISMECEAIFTDFSSSHMRYNLNVWSHRFFVRLCSILRVWNGTRIK